MTRPSLPDMRAKADRISHPLSLTPLQVRYVVEEGSTGIQPWAVILGANDPDISRPSQAMVEVKLIKES